MNFSCDDHSYRSWEAAKEFTALLQAVLPETPGFEWVERVEMERVENEQSLGLMGILSRKDSVRVGELLGVDWAVYGRFSTNSGTQRTLTLELFNLRRAHFIATTNFTFAVESRSRLSPSPEIAVQVAKLLVPWMVESRRRLRPYADLPRVALLNAGYSPGVMELHRQANHGFTDSKLPPVLTTGFSEAGSSIEEAELMWLGLTDNSSNSWRGTADYYVWQLPDVSVIGADGVKKKQSVLRVWAGQGEPHSFTNDLKSVSQTALDWIIQQSRRNPTTTSGDELRWRRVIVEELLSRMLPEIYQDQTMGFGESGKYRWLRLVRDLEACCFLDPGNARAREALLRVRWNLWIAHEFKNQFLFNLQRRQAWGEFAERFGTVSSLDTNLILNRGMCETVACEIINSALRYSPSSGPLDVDRSTMDAWEKEGLLILMQRVNLVGDVPEARNLLGSAVHRILSSKLLDKKEIVEFAEVWLPRIIAAPLDFRWAFPEASDFTLVKQCYESVGRGAEGDAWVKKLMAAGGQALKKRRSDESRSATVSSLPRIGILENSSTKLLLDDGPIDWGIPSVGAPVFQAVKFPQDEAATVSLHLTVTPNDAWLITNGKQPIKERIGGDKLNQQIQSGNKESRLLWRINTNNLAAKLWTNGLAMKDPIATFYHDNELWVGFDFALSDKHSEVFGNFGIPRAEMERMQKTYLLKINLSDLSVNSLLDTNFQRIWNFAEWQGKVIGAGYHTIKSDASTGGWQVLSQAQRIVASAHYHELTVSADKALVYYGMGVLHSLDGEFTYPIDYDKYSPGLPIVGDGKGGFWLNQKGLSWFEPGTTNVWRETWYMSTKLDTSESARWQTVTEQISGVYHHDHFSKLKAHLARRKGEYHPHGRLSGEVTALAMDGDWLWVATQGEVEKSPRLQVMHVPSRRWAGGFALTRPIHHLVVTQDHLWFARRSEAGRWLKKDLIHPDKTKWVSMELSYEEVVEQEKSLPPKAKAIRALWRGDSQPLLALYQDRLIEELEPEDLMLLALAHDELGTNQPELRRRYEDHLIAEFSEGLCGSVVWLRKWQRFATAEAQAQPVSVEMERGLRHEILFKRYDINSDRMISADELNVMMEVEPEQVYSVRKGERFRGMLPSYGAFMVSIHATKGAISLNEQEFGRVLEGERNPNQQVVPSVFPRL